MSEFLDTACPTLAEELDAKKTPLSLNYLRHSLASSDVVTPKEVAARLMEHALSTHLNVYMHTLRQLDTDGAAEGSAEDEAAAEPEEAVAPRQRGRGRPAAVARRAVAALAAVDAARRTRR